VKNRTTSSSHKKVVVRPLQGKDIRGYLNPAHLGRGETIDLLTPDGEHQQIPLQEIKSVYFVRDFTENFEPERKAFVSRPKLDGLWVRMKFRDNDALEGIVANDLLELLDRGVQIIPPDLHGQSQRIFIPRSALAEMKVLGVVGIARRKPAAAPAPTQPKLFSE
jgi:hypothetical protein